MKISAYQTRLALVEERLTPYQLQSVLVEFIKKNPEMDERIADFIRWGAKQEG